MRGKVYRIVLILLTIFIYLGALFCGTLILKR